MVISDTLNAFSQIMQYAWNLMCGVTVPGLDISFGAWFIALFIAGIVLKLLYISLGLGSGEATHYRSGQSGKKHISDERKHDEK